ncbi:MAG: hypothetical protein QOF58_275 [Pseudonocardiales bacterium]|nr:hypothetical protein [Pseudonocardiales bacterium]
MGIKERIRAGEVHLALHGLHDFIPAFRRLVWSREILWYASVISIVVGLFGAVVG